jgi:chromosome segregation ATPase
MFSLKPKEGGGAVVPPTPQTPTSQQGTSMTKIALGICGVAILGLGYNGYSTRVALEERISSLEQANQKADSTITKLTKDTTAIASDVQVVGKKLGVTSQELDASRKYAERIRQEQELAKQQLATELATKASSTDVANVAKEASTKLAEAQQDANTKIGSVSGEVKTVSTKLDATNADLAASRREITDVRTTLSQQIARNSSELSDLRKKGERDFFEFDIKKDRKNPLAKVADIQLELKNTDTKRQRYDVVVHVDDAKLEKKDRTANEPVQFLVGRDKLRYEVVVNFVDKDRIRGYLSTPKDKVLSAERPKLSQPQ